MMSKPPACYCPGVACRCDRDRDRDVGSAGVGAIGGSAGVIAGFASAGVIAGLASARVAEGLPSCTIGYAPSFISELGVAQQTSPPPISVINTNES